MIFRLGASSHPTRAERWLVDCSAPSDLSRSQLPAILSKEEIERADRFINAEAKERFCLARLALRLVLSSYSEIAPEAIEFMYNDSGKPQLAMDDHDSSPINFNQSHTDDYVIMAICADRQVGIDLERVSPLPELETLIETVCTPGERMIFWGLSGRERVEHFFSIWTAKEAVLKGAGLGFLSLRTNLPVEIGTINPEGKCHTICEYAGRTWNIYSFLPIAGHIAALAVESDDTQIDIPPCRNVRIDELVSNLR